MMKSVAGSVVVDVDAGPRVLCDVVAGDQVIHVSWSFEAHENTCVRVAGYGVVCDGVVEAGVTYGYAVFKVVGHVVAGDSGGV